VARSDAARAEPIVVNIGDLRDTGLNPLLQAAMPLLLLAGQLRATFSAPDVPGLKRQALDEVRRFEDRAKSAGVHHDVIVAARYALCVMFDEAVLSMPWGAQSEWMQESLLVILHREGWGGEKFFELLEGISRSPERHVDLMELQYVCLAFGLTGKYRDEPTQLAEVQRNLYRRIREQRGAPESQLSLRWRGLEDRRNPVMRYVPWWVVGAAALAMLAIGFTIFSTRLSGAGAPVHAQLAAIGREAFAEPRPAGVIAGPSLKQLLAAEEATGLISVEERDGRTLITLVARDLFASGSATSNPTYEPVLQRIAKVLAGVPGRVLVVGHTDDQPVRSLRFGDNVALSRERAVSVATVLQAANPGRIESAGVGAAEPKFRPESTPENRARNRRVEIFHVRGS
jgi:type VI secretion system protein ImpK